MKIDVEKQVFRIRQHNFCLFAGAQNNCHPLVLLLVFG